MNIFIVIKDAGDDSDYSRDIVCAYKDKNDAEKESTRLNGIIGKRIEYNNVLSAFTATSGGEFSKKFPPPLYDPRYPKEWNDWSVRREEAAREHMRTLYPGFSDKADPAQFFSADETYLVQEVELR